MIKKASTHPKMLYKASNSPTALKLDNGTFEYVIVLDEDEEAEAKKAGFKDKATKTPTKKTVKKKAK